jgi:hypothetical protein
LRAHAKGLYHAEAAVELLIGHRRWLCCEEFVGRFVWVGRALVGGGLLAVVDWAAAVKALDARCLSCSDTEAHVLRIAASIAAGAAVDLRECLSTLDGVNGVLAARAVLAAGGHRVAAAAIAGVTSR